MLAALLTTVLAAPLTAVPVRPDSQALFVELDPSKPRVTGSTIVWFTLADSARTLALESHALTVSRVSLQGPRGTVTTAWAAGDAALTVDAIGGLAPGGYELAIGFDAPWRERGGWRRESRGRVRLDSLDLAAAFPCAGDSAATHWRLHVQTPARSRAHAPLANVRRERDREVEVSEWVSAQPLPASALRLRAAPRAVSARPGSPRPARPTRSAAGSAAPGP